MFKKISMLAAAAVLAMGTAASAATIDFTSSGTGESGLVNGGPLSYVATAASGGGNGGGAVVTENGNGLGVRSNNGGGQINGGPFLGFDTLTITFSWAVNLIDFTLSLVDGNDDFLLSFNGGLPTFYGAGFTNPVLGQNNVTSFSITAIGTFLVDGFTTDDFRLESANVASVPVPAAGLLLVGALGGLAALRRRKTA